MVEKLASSEIAQSRELQQAIQIANLFLERPYFDPDGDECVLARQFLRQQERLKAAERDTRERLDKEWSRMFFNPYTNNRKEGRCCKCLCHCPSINEMAHHATCPVLERIRGKE